MESTKIANTTMFLVSVLITGAIAGAFVWLLLFLINLGIESLWDRVPMYLGEVYPLVVCIIGGIVIGLFVKRYGPYPEDLQTVMATVKKTGRYDYDKIGRMSVGAILPLAFGGSVGPEAGLTGAIAALCTWVGDRLKRFGGDFRELSRAGTYAALSAIFTAPLYGFAGAMDGSRADCDEELVISSRPMRIAVYAFAIVGAILTFILLSRALGGGLSLPRYTDISYGTDELIWLIPIAVVGSLGGWLFCVLEVCFKRVSDLFGERPVLKAVIAGAVLGSLGIVLPLTMFSGSRRRRS